MDKMKLQQNVEGKIIPRQRVLITVMMLFLVIPEVKICGFKITFNDTDSPQDDSHYCNSDPDFSSIAASSSPFYPALWVFSV